MYLINDKQSIQPLIDEDPIAHLNTIGRLQNGKDIEIYVDSLENPKGFVLKDGYWAIPYSKDEGVLKKILKNYPFQDHVGFCGLPMTWVHKIREELTEYQLDWEEHCELFYLPEENAHLIPQEQLPSLSPKDVDIVNHYYTYKEEGSREYLLECIENRPSSVIIGQAGKPVSWALVREDNSMGVMYTVDAYRKRGLAKKITGDLLRKVRERGNTPYVHIVETNNASKNLAKELGLIYWGDVLWFGLKKKDISNKE